MYGCFLSSKKSYSGKTKHITIFANILANLPHCGIIVKVFMRRLRNTSFILNLLKRSWFLILISLFLFNACNPQPQNTFAKEPIEETLPSATPVKPSATATQTKQPVTPVSSPTPVPPTATKTNLPPSPTPSPTFDPKSHSIDFDVNALEDTLIPGVNWYYFFKDLDTDQIIIEHDIEGTFHPSSLIKIPLASIILKLQEELGREINAIYEEEYYGKTLDIHMYNMIVHSDEGSASILEKYATDGFLLRTKDIMERWGLEKTRFAPRRSSCKELAWVLENLFEGTLLSEDSTDYLLGLMSVETELDYKYFGVILDELPGAIITNKYGYMYVPTVVSDYGIIQYGGKTYLGIIVGEPDGTLPLHTEYRHIGASINAFAYVFAQHLKTLDKH